jgi:WD40 repeat protein
MCKYDRLERQSIFTIIAVLAYQLSLQNKIIADEMKAIRAITPSMRSAKTAEPVMELIEALLVNPLKKAFEAKTLTQSVIFIDALDELLPPIRSLLLSVLLNKKKNSLISLPFVKIVLSSRLDDDIVRLICSSAEQRKSGDVCNIQKTDIVLDGSKHNADDLRIIAQDRLKPLIAADSLDAVVVMLVKRVDGIFRFLQMIIENVKEMQDGKNKDKLTLADVESMQQGTLYDEYRSYFERLRQQTEAMRQDKPESVLSWDQIRRMFAIVSAAQKPLTILQLCAVLQSADKQDKDHPYLKTANNDFAIGLAVDLSSKSSIKLSMLTQTVSKASGMLRLTTSDSKSAIKAELQKLPPNDGSRIPKDSHDILIQAMESTVEIFHKSVQDWMKEENADYGKEGSSEGKTASEVQEYKSEYNINYSGGHQYIALACLRELLQRKQDKKQLDEMPLCVLPEATSNALILQNAIYHPMRMYGVAFALEHAIEGCADENDEDDDRIACLNILTRLASSLAYIHLRARAGNCKQIVSVLSQADEIFDTIDKQLQLTDNHTESTNDFKIWKQSMVEVFTFIRKMVYLFSDEDTADTLWQFALNQPKTSLMHKQALILSDRHNAFIIANISQIADSRLQVIYGHNSDVNSVAFSPDGSLLASGSSDFNVILWSVKTGEQFFPRPLQGHSASVTSVTFSPDGLTIASGSFDNSVILWNVKSGEQIMSLNAHENKVNSVAFSPDGSILASGSCDNSIVLWNAKTGEQISRLKGPCLRICF